MNIDLGRPYKNREISWLSFNERVLQEAQDPTVPILERIKFLGIVSSNLDEFFRVRVATLQRMERLGVQELPLTKDPPRLILDLIQEKIIKQQHSFEETYANILQELKWSHIYILRENQINEEQSDFVRHYFHEKVRPYLIPIMLEQVQSYHLSDHAIYLAVQLHRSQRKSAKYSLIEIPTHHVSRFLVIENSRKSKKKNIILLDDVIRHNLSAIFATLNFDFFQAYTIKVTRDAELDLEVYDSTFASYIQTVAKSLRRRPMGQPVRFIYDKDMPLEMLQHLKRKFKVTGSDNIIPGGRYHNFRDFIKFPKVGQPELHNPSFKPIPHPDIKLGKSLFKALESKDMLLFYPYHSFNTIIDLLREAAIDPYVESIKITLYRAAENSKIINALINAVKNGKQVTAVIELQARFDEEANINWSTKLSEEGVRVIYGVPNYKVHAKLCLITRQIGHRVIHYGHVGTGNFNEDTAKLYSDISLLTANPAITEEIEQVFHFFDDNVFIGNYKHLLVSPVFMRAAYETMIQREIYNASQGKEAFIIVKTNSLVDETMGEFLYKASQAGVQVRLMIRGTCAVRPGFSGMGENIQAISIVDKFLEHARIFVFCNGGEHRYYISSADWMTRNLDYRVEVSCPIFAPHLQEQLRNYLKIQWMDNTKARILDTHRINRNYFRKSPESTPSYRAQDVFGTYLENGEVPEVSHVPPLFPDSDKAYQSSIPNYNTEF